MSTGLKIGKTAIGFLSVYPTPDELISKGDDDEACAWLWQRRLKYYIIRMMLE